jgi:hypothetical protein
LPTYESLGLVLLPNETMIGRSRLQVRAAGHWAFFTRGPGGFLMIFTSRCTTVVSSLVMLLVALVLASSQAQGQVVKPFKVVGAGTADYVPVVPLVPVPHTASGEGTELGRYQGAGEVQLLGFTGPTTANFDSGVPFVFVAANGDKLACTYGDTTNGAAEPGQVTLYPTPEGLVVAVWVAEFNPVLAQCTGRFAKLIGGSFIMVAVTEPFVLGAFDPVGYVWAGEGTLTFKKGK